MSSWLARSIANSLHLDEDENGAVPRYRTPNDAVPSISTQDRGRLPHNSDSDADEDRGLERGVKEDLSELKDSLTRQFWGVASFLAPPPPPPPPPFAFPRGRKSNSVYAESERDGCGSGNEGEGFSGSVYYSESEDCDGDDNRIEEEAVGITEEVLAFAMNIAHHPETWLDFPLSEEEEEFDDFDLSDLQYKHVLAVEHLSPRLAALRNELCPAHMTDGYFWMVYFVLLHSRLYKHDADLLSSPQLLKARAKWMHQLQKHNKEDPHWLSTSILQAKRSAESSPRDNLMTHSNEDAHFGHISERISSFESTVHHMTAHHETVKHLYNEIEFVDKSVIKEDPLPKLEEKEMIVGPSTPKLNLYDNDDEDDDDDDDDWLKEDEDLVGLSGTSVMVNEEDISFSDLEDDTDCSMPVKTKQPYKDQNVVNCPD